MTTLQTFTHRYLPSADNNPTTLLLLHGTGGDENSLLSLGRQFAPGAALLSPRGNVLEGQYPRFFRRHSEGVLDFEDLHVRTHELGDWIEAAVKEYGLAPESLVAVGYSNGANIAANLLLQRPGLVRRAALLRVMLLPSPIPAPDLKGTSVLISSGVADQLLPLADAEKLAENLEGFGAQVTFQRQPTDHRLISADLETVQNWLSETQPA